MIKIKAPRYRDRSVLVARYRIPCGQDITLEIQTGAFKGIYKITNDTICKSPIEGMETKQGQIMAVRVIPIDAMERVE